MANMGVPEKKISPYFYAAVIGCIVAMPIVKRYDLSELRDITRSFRMIGTELNQIAKVANSTGEVTGKAVEEIKRQYEILEGVFENYLKPLKPNVIL